MSGGNGSDLAGGIFGVASLVLGVAGDLLRAVRVRAARARLPRDRDPAEPEVPRASTRSRPWRS